jgi:microcystin-dependent protein
MADPFVAEIRIFAFQFAPQGWAFCDGQLMPISQNTALYSLLGTAYGGDGHSTFALPDLQGQAAISAGQSTIGSQYFEGQVGGSESVTLISTEMPIHTHTVSAVDAPATSNSPAGKAWAKSVVVRQEQKLYHDASGATTTMNSMAFSLAGGSMPHNNMPPYLTLNFCIAVQGIYPSRG